MKSDKSLQAFIFKYIDEKEISYDDVANELKITFLQIARFAVGKERLSVNQLIQLLIYFDIDFELCIKRNLKNKLMKHLMKFKK